MSACLVQQLFRLKVGEELDQHLVDDVLFPMLRSRKHPSKDLLLDIKMTQRWDNYGESMIMIPGRRFRRNLPDGADASAGTMINMSPFTTMVREGLRWLEVVERTRLGTVNSRFRREMTTHQKWGTVDILNELRELKHPVIECHPVPDSHRHFDLHGKRDDWPGDAFIHVAEMNGRQLREIVVSTFDKPVYLRGSWSKSPLYSNDKMLRNREKAIIKEDLQFVNRYLEYSLSNGGLYWVTQLYIRDRFSYASRLSSYY
jgi:hypothetical protein